MRLVSDRPAEHIATGKVMSSQFMFDDALQSERDLGINDWEPQCPYTDGIGVAVIGRDGKTRRLWRCSQQP